MGGCFLLVSKYYFANYCCIAGGIFGYYGASRRTSEFVFVMTVLLSLDGIKNMSILYFMISDMKNLNQWKWFLFCLLIFQELVILPCGIYSGFWLYRALGMEGMAITHRNSSAYNRNSSYSENKS